MNSPLILVNMLQLNYHIIQRQLNGVTAEESFIQPPYYGNCINWVLGHIIEGRNRMLQGLQVEPLWTEAEAELYKRYSQPITSVNDPHLPYDRLLADLNTAHERLVGLLSELTPEAYASYNGDPDDGLGEVDVLGWHETYHVGQLDLLRQVTGKNDKVI